MCASSAQPGSGIDLLTLADLVAPREPLGHFFVRFANFVNGELWGGVTHVPCAVVFCNAHITAADNGVCPAGTAPRHPRQLYEAGLEGRLMFLLLRWRPTAPDGVVADLIA